MQKKCDCHESAPVLQAEKSPAKHALRRALDHQKIFVFSFLLCMPAGWPVPRIHIGKSGSSADLLYRNHSRCWNRSGSSEVPGRSTLRMRSIFCSSLRCLPASSASCLPPGGTALHPNNRWYSGNLRMCLPPLPDGRSGTDHRQCRNTLSYFSLPFVLSVSRCMRSVILSSAGCTPGAGCCLWLRSSCTATCTLLCTAGEGRLRSFPKSFCLP